MGIILKAMSIHWRGLSRDKYELHYTVITLAMVWWADWRGVTFGIRKQARRLFQLSWWDWGWPELGCPKGPWWPCPWLPLQLHTLSVPSCTLCSMFLQFNELHMVSHTSRTVMKPGMLGHISDYLSLTVTWVTVIFQI